MPHRDPSSLVLLGVSCALQHKPPPTWQIQSTRKQMTNHVSHKVTRSSLNLPPEGSPRGARRIQPETTCCYPSLSETAEVESWGAAEDEENNPNTPLTYCTILQGATDNRSTPHGLRCIKRVVVCTVICPIGSELRKTTSYSRVCHGYGLRLSIC